MNVRQHEQHSGGSSRVNFLIAGQLRPPGDSVELRTPGVGALVASRAPGDKKGARFDLVFGISPPPLYRSFYSKPVPS